ncbi:MAG TPA: hypothetical protein VFY48_02580 [Solirubrobacterales bacterium]|nr:hypothetical protein [Solirubrobacterales bacterium]
MQAAGKETVGATLPKTLEAILDSVGVPVPAGALRAMAAAALPDRNVTSEALGRVAAYAEGAYLRSRTAPRFAWVIDPDASAPKPRIWARGTWRLARRIRTEEAVSMWQAVLAHHLCERMVEGSEAEREMLGPVALEAVARVLGPRAMHLPGGTGEWASIRSQLTPLANHPLGRAHPFTSQMNAEGRLEAQGFSLYALYFGAGETVVASGSGLPTGLRLPHPAEEGTPFDQLVLEKADRDPKLAREVLAYLQEWGEMVDREDADPGLDAYAERWRVDLPTARARNELFRSLFPGERTPQRIWRLLWDPSPGRSVARLIGREVVVGELPPTVVNHFVNCLADAMRGNSPLGAEVMRETVTYEEGGELPASRELRRFFALCEQARLWSAQALVAAGEPELAAGALSLEPVFEQSVAAFNEVQLGRYRKQLPKGPARELLRYAQRALRVAATLDALDPPPSTAPYLSGVQLAAQALAVAASEELAIDLVAEAGKVVRALQAVP